MKKMLLTAVCLAALGFSPAFGQSAAVYLTLVNPNPTSTILVGQSFTLDVELTGASMQTLDSFNLSLDLGSTGDLAVTSFTEATGPLAAPNFTGAQAAQHPTEFSSYSNAPDGSDDLSIPSTTPILATATFTASQTGTYNIGFVTSAPFFYTELIDYNGNDIAFTPISASVVVVTAPEPRPISLLAVALTIGACLLAWKRKQVANMA